MENRTDTACVTVSVIMPAYNAEAYIETAIRSVVAQTFTDWELIVIDDCSRDATVEIVENLACEDSRITLLRNEVNMGVSKTRNRGLDFARGSFVAFLDSDDVWYPEKLKVQLECLERTGADFAYCSYAIVNADGETAKADYIVPESITFESMLRKNDIGCSTVLLTAPIVKKYRFGSGFYHEDYVLWMQLLRDGYQACGNVEILVDWRYIENSRSFDKRKSAKNRWLIYRNYLGLSLIQSLWAFSGYAVSGVKKYFRKR
jgi:teichuronic acid biosynthesis glycosyltransferase TuaG